MGVRDDKHPGRHEDILKLPTKSDDVLDMLRYGVKSALRPLQTPFPVVASEKRQEMELAGRNMTEVAIVMKKLSAERGKHKGRKTTWAR